MFVSGLAAATITAVAITTQNPLLLLGHVFTVWQLYAARKWTTKFSSEKEIKWP